MTDEVKTLSKYRKSQKTFGKLFLVSFCVFLVSLLVSPLFLYQGYSASPNLSNSPAENANSTVYGTPSDSEIPRATPVLSNTSIRNTNSAAYNRPLNRISNKTSNNTTPRISPPLAPAPAGDGGFPFVLMAFVVTGAFSFMATVFTFLGFLTMTIFAWRKERREAASFRLENSKKEIEIEKLKIELEKSRHSPAAPVKKCTSCNRTYSDVSLNFCLDDGAVLSDVHTSEESGQNPFNKPRVTESSIPTEQISAETDEIKNKNTAK